MLLRRTEYRDRVSQRTTRLTLLESLVCRRLRRRNVDRSIEGGQRRFFAARDAIAVLEHDATKPAGERRGFSQRRQRAVCFGERFLRRVLGKVIVAEERRRIRDGNVLERGDEFGECAFVAALRGADCSRDAFSVGTGRQGLGPRCLSE